MVAAKHDWRAALVDRFPAILRIDEPMSRWTTFHCAGRAEFLAAPRTLQELQDLVRFCTEWHLKWLTDWRVIGRGSNLLIRDGGFRGLLIDLGTGLSKIEEKRREGKDVWVRGESGVPNGTFLQWLRDRHLKGFGFSFGIPGSLGGGIRMNAGTPLGCFADVLEQVEGIDLEGTPVAWGVSGKDFAYRDFPKGRQIIVTAGTFHLKEAEASEVENEIEQAKDLRKNQPLDFPNVGSVFKNPPGDFAGRLIEAAGLKGKRIGDAEISMRHANWIVNIGRAKTGDALQLIHAAQEAVKTQFGVHLEPEVHVIGEEP